MNKEKVRELAEKLALLGGRADENELILLVWLEQNKPEPAVVGLSEKQIEDLASDLALASDGLCTFYEQELRKWLENQTFSKPEAKEVPVGLSDKQVEDLADFLTLPDYKDMDADTIQLILDTKEWLKTQTFAQPEVKEAVVGLSDEQIKKVSRHIANEWDSDDYIGYEASLRRALDKHEFSTHNNEGKVYELDGSVTDYKEAYESISGSFVSLEEEYSRLNKKLEQLKSQQFTPNWDDAPEWANWLAQDDTGEWCWFENEPEMKISGGIWDVKGKKLLIPYVKNWKQTLQQRPRDMGIPVTEQKEVTAQNVEESTDESEKVAKRSPQFEVNWNDAPADATSMCIIHEWYKNGTLCLREMVYRGYRLKPAQVEVGQVWGLTHDEYAMTVDVIATGDMKVCNDYHESVTYLLNGNARTTTLSDFLAKFERVQP